MNEYLKYSMHPISRQMHCHQSPKPLRERHALALLARELIARLEATQDLRPLSTGEAWLCRKLKCTYLGLASLERSIVRQRTRFRWLREGDASTAFLKIHAAHRRQKNHIFQLHDAGLPVSEDAGMARLAYEHFSSIFGSHTPRDSTIDLGAIDHPIFDMSDLDAPFSEQEIWEAVKRLPAGKAPGPDGFTAEFLRACWDIIKQDICDVFLKLYQMNGCGFHKLNEALLTLLPKKADASSLSRTIVP
jgi:hypothetical protein